MTQASTYNEPSAKPATSGSFKISVRDAVRGEALSRARRCLSREEVSLEELANLSSALLCRNAVTELAQKYLGVMTIAPVCDFREFDYQFLRDKKLDALASQTDAYRMMRETDLFFQDAAIGQPHTEPQLFVIHSLLAAGCHPGQGFEDKLKTAIAILEEGMIALRAVKASARSSETSSNTNKDGLGSLRQTCNIDQEFELRVYRNEGNKTAYDTLGVIEYKRE
ncbi:hypothetical protein D6D01_03289 [Aureobasidium pullulans]|uniref:Uncharacterized protein n=1 Tax=Aureobasidium pullulans TaxID=5580 RepID=A0A4S9LMI2_AURPU|nr:hypothetical protein D6D01_03289 [Aureobasidium pullulans]